MPERNNERSGDKKINLNTATKEDLDNIPQMAGKRAETVLHYREQHGPFKQVNEIANIPGIGDVMATQLAEYFEVG